jgi:hypothetical protein
MLDKKEKIDSHLGLKVRKSKRQKDHEVQLVSWGKHQAQYKQQQQGGAHGPETPTTTTTYATTTANLAAPAKRGKHGRSSKHYSRRESPASSHCCTQLAAAMRQKFVQFALALHLLQH